jgi:hypothetical protein
MGTTKTPSLSEAAKKAMKNPRPVYMVYSQRISSKERKYEPEPTLPKKYEKIALEKPAKEILGPDAQQIKNRIDQEKELKSEVGGRK